VGALRVSEPRFGSCIRLAGGGAGGSGGTGGSMVGGGFKGLNLKLRRF
jgi:hypothetical protein